MHATEPLSGVLHAARYSQHKTNQRKKGQPPGVVDVTVHPQQNRIVLQLSLQHAVDDEAGALLQPIAIVLIGDAGQNLLNASCICNTEAEHNAFMQLLLVDVSRCHSAMQNRRMCAAPHCCCFRWGWWTASPQCYLCTNQRSCVNSHNSQVSQ